MLRRHWLNYVFPGVLLVSFGIPGAALFASGRGDDAQRIIVAVWGALCPLSGVAFGLYGFFTRSQRVVFDKECGEARLGRRAPILLSKIRGIATVVKEHGTRDKRGRRQEVFHVELRTADRENVR